MANSDVYVLSSIHEGFGIVSQEVMQVGLPIIATNNGGQTDFIQDGSNGYLIDPRSPEQICDRVEGITSDKNIIQNQKLNYSKEKIAKEYECL